MDPVGPPSSALKPLIGNEREQAAVAIDNRNMAQNLDTMRLRRRLSARLARRNPVASGAIVGRHLPRATAPLLATLDWKGHNVNALISGDFTENEDPDALFDAWMAEATESESRDPNAIALATVDQSGCPDVRMVLLKGKDPRGFVFYTNTESAKGQELAANAQAAFVLYWKSLNRQVRVRGSVAPVTDAEADAYFASRHPKSRIGAWASQQSRPLESRAVLEREVAVLEERFGDGPIPRPSYWRGFRVVPFAIEFWADRPSRLHDRIVFRRQDGGAWTKQRLYP